MVQDGEARRLSHRSGGITGVGDEIVAAGQAQRLWDADPSAGRIAICGADGRVRWHEIWEWNPIIAKPVDVAAGERVRKIVSGPNCRPYIVPPFTAETGWTFNRDFRCRDHVAQIHLTEAEDMVGFRTYRALGPYVLIEPFTKHENFRWPLERWEALVGACPDLTFVQHTHKDSRLVSGAHRLPATFREACGLAKHAEVYVRSESGMCHAAAALGVRQVTLFGGCMDPEVMGYYPGQTVIADHGEGSPCGSWRPCAHCTEAMDRITVEEVVRALRDRLARRAA